MSLVSSSANHLTNACIYPAAPGGGPDPEVGAPAARAHRLMRYSTSG